MRPITKLLVANRSEIAIRVFRSAHELGIRTVAIYAHEDRFALHRFKADEAYLAGKPGEPIRSYLDIEGIVALAKAHGVDGIHPGYGFLSENPEFAAACVKAGITFVGPRVELLETLGDKTAARELARQAGVPILAGSPRPVASLADALSIAKELGWPVILKAAHGGGGRGMRVVRGEDELAVALESAQRESKTAFGSAAVFVEKFIQRARHIEVQLLGDLHGNLVHLFERDCSVQRRHQKVVELAPAPNLAPQTRDAICEAAVCYTGDVLDPKRTKYSLDYYVKLAKELEKAGAQMLAIKDMAGLCKPFAAGKLVKALHDEVGIPIHFHTHDTSGAQVASALEAAKSGASIVDAAFASFAGLTSQPNLNALVEATRNTPLDTGLDPEPLRHFSHYWAAVREHYTAFECGMKAPDADLYLHEMPGGQFTNLLEQAKALGLGDSWEEVCRAYADVNQLVGDIVKVTPTSKSVGDLALLLVTNSMHASDLLSDSRELAFPESVIDLLAGRMGQPPGGFPAEVVKRIVRASDIVTGRPGESLPPADFAAAEKKVAEIAGRAPSPREVLSWLLYPRVFADFAAHRSKHGDVSVLPTPAFLEGPKPGEELSVDIEPGKTLLIRLLTVGEPHADGTRTVFFELNGQPRSVSVADKSLEAKVQRRPKAVIGDAREVGAPMPGLIVTVAVKPGDVVTKGQKLLSLEAMKMETTVYAERDGRLAEVLVAPGTPVEAGELVARYADA